MTEAHCYLGVDMEQRGRLKEALAHFRWVKEHGDQGSYEYTIALTEIEHLMAKAAPTAQP
jgi:hypothetical protein